MLLQLTQVFDIEGNEAEVSFPMDLTDCDVDGVHPFNQPISVCAKAVNRAGVVTLSYSITSAIQLRCDRCLTMFPYDLNITGQQILVRKLHDQSFLDEDYLEVPNDCLDVSELARDEIFLRMPSKILCKEECKGLCPKCGINLNTGSCQCGKKEVDPRLQILGQLLNEMSEDET